MSRPTSISTASRSGNVPTAGQESVQVVGFNLDTPLGAPWNIVAGTVQDLKAPDAVFIDELYREKLGVTHLGQVIEIRDHRARVVGFTHGIRTFTTAPYVFTSFKNAQNYSRTCSEDQTALHPREGRSGVPDRRSFGAPSPQRLTDVDVVTSARVQPDDAFLLDVFDRCGPRRCCSPRSLGLVVGVVVVAQTIYATTMDHIREYGTLKALARPTAISTA